MSETIGGYLIRRLGEEGVGHVFGVPGDYVLSFYKRSGRRARCRSSIPATSRARASPPMPMRGFNGLGVVCITYCVGGLKIANTTAQAYRREVAGDRHQRRAGNE